MSESCQDQLSCFEGGAAACAGTGRGPAEGAADGGPPAALEKPRLRGPSVYLAA